MHTNDALTHLDHQLDELQFLAQRLGDDATLLRVGRLRSLLVLLEELREQPACIPQQRAVAT